MNRTEVIEKLKVEVPAFATKVYSYFVKNEWKGYGEISIEKLADRFNFLLDSLGRMQDEVSYTSSSFGALSVAVYPNCDGSWWGALHLSNLKAAIGEKAYLEELKVGIEDIGRRGTSFSVWYWPVNGNINKSKPECYFTPGKGFSTLQAAWDWVHNYLLKEDSNALYNITDKMGNSYESNLLYALYGMKD